MPRRTNKQIKEYTLKSGKKKWKFQAYIGLDENGKQICVTRQGFNTYNKAASELTKLKAKGIEKSYQRPNQIKFDEIYDLWFENYKDQVKESTANKLLIMYRNHIKPVFGNKYMDKVQVKTIQRFADKKAKEIVKYKDVVRQVGILYEYAIRLGYVKENPVKRIIMPKRTARPRRDIKHNVYSREELEEFLATAKNYSIRPYTYFYLLSTTGLRKSEALALTWNDVDLVGNKISITKTLSYGYDNKLIIQSPKSEMSNRVVPISTKLKQVLLEFQNYERKQALISNKLFHTSLGKYLTLSKPDQWLRAIYKTNPKLKKITIHGFRHTFATLLISETNVKPKTVQMLMGHETIAMTMNIYTHINNSNRKDAISSIKTLNI
ncbi:site-specific integrase [Lactobacillus sp. ESL0701]|uniref:tyrosine-type recombinase/integrase n=1 Tax=Lactobacillus sp. ESL0701 TaxID=2983217 RepID=UPI0023F997EE|nr:site-specific integrase [Lactobacillus sp. ESL0701]MDF7672195.1 site-specific integrase [Lactobacillus sp. ESL0701]